MINITRPFLPPERDYKRYLEDIWKRNWLTNDGPLVNDLELKLKNYLELNHLLFVSNGTIALQIAIKALDLKGEIITTPFSFIATTSSIVWENCIPVFVDIDERSFNIDPDLIENAITPKTTAILATHVYGNPCEIDKIDKIARRYNLKVIYDAAHCFGTKYRGKSVFSFGDISITSFHATKLFHTIEGGALITKSPALTKKISLLRNFGFNGPENFDGVGINGKNSEFHAAMGLCNLKYVDEILKKGKKSSNYYDKKLKPLKIQKPEINENSEFNYSYYPIVFKTEKELLKSKKELENNRIFSRRYFFPPLSKVDYVKYCETPVADDISRRVLCLPLFYHLTFEEIDFISRILIRTQNY